MRQQIRVVAAIALAVASFAAAPAALAATPTPEPSPFPTAEPWTYAEYTGTLSATDFNRDGKTQVQAPVPYVVSIRCGDDGCVLHGMYLGDQYDFAIEGASGSWTGPPVGSICESSTYWSGGSMTAEATPQKLVVTQELDLSAIEFCPSETYRWGSHRIFEGTLTSGDPCVLEGAPCPPAPEPTVEPTVDAVAAGSATPGEPRPPATPSVLSTLPTPAETLAPSQVLLAAVLTLVLVILMALPTHLLNTAVDSGSERLAGLRSRLRGRPDAPATAPRKGKYPGLLAAGLGVLAAGVISCFIDPAFGLDAASVRTLASVLVSFAIEVVLAWFIVIWVVKRSQPGAEPTFRFAPLTLLVVVATVVFTRLTGFEPGIVFGLVAGVAFGAALATAGKARVALTGLGYAFVIAVLAWIAFAATAGIENPNAVLVFVRESFSAITIAGIAALPIALIPLRGLAGYDVWKWNRWVWTGAYAVGLLGFFLVLLPMPFSWDGVHASLWTWIALYLIYAAVAVGIWAAVVQPWKKVDAPVSHS